MSTTTITPYMSLVLPIPGLELGPQYGIDNNTAFSTIDSHDHTSGKGLQITSGAMLINADLPIHNFNLTQIRSSRYQDQMSPLSLPTDLDCVYVSNGELFFNDGAGNNVQITLAGAVDVSGSGNITGMGATTASAVYTSINHTFSFYSNINTPALLNIGPVSIGRNVVSPNQVTLTTSNTIPAPYTQKFADSLPVQQSMVTIDATGQQANVPPDNSTIAIVGGLLTAYLPPGAMMPYGGAGSAPTGWLYCFGNDVSRTTYAALFAAIGTAYGSGNGSTTFTLPQLQGMFMRGWSGGSGNDPDAASRTAAAPGGNTGNNVGSAQGSDFASHNHTQNSHNHTQNAHNHTGSQASHSHTVNAHTHAENVRTGVPAVNPGGSGSTSSINTTDTNGNGQAVVSTESASPGTDSQTPAVTVDNNTATNNAATATNNVTGGNESRPVNLYVNFLIKT